MHCLYLICSNHRCVCFMKIQFNSIINGRFPTDFRVTIEEHLADNSGDYLFIKRNNYFAC